MGGSPAGRNEKRHNLGHLERTALAAMPIKCLPFFTIFRVHRSIYGFYHFTIFTIFTIFLLSAPHYSCFTILPIAKK